MTTSPLPVPPLTPTLAPSLTPEPTPQPAILEMPAEPEMSTVTEEPVAIITQPSPKVEPKVELEVEMETKAPRLVRLIPTHGFPIRHFNGGIVFYPNQPSAEVPVDAWLENQMRRGILKEV